MNTYADWIQQGGSPIVRGGGAFTRPVNPKAIARARAKAASAKRDAEFARYLAETDRWLDGLEQQRDMPRLSTRQDRRAALAAAITAVEGEEGLRRNAARSLGHVHELYYEADRRTQELRRAGAESWY